MTIPLALVVVVLVGCVGAVAGRTFAARRAAAAAVSVAGYPVEAVLGSGSTSTVYLGRDPHGGQVAVKVLHRLSGEDHAGTRARVDQEVAALRAVASDQLPRFREVAEDPAGVVVVTDFVDGATLTAVLARNGRLSGPAAAAILEGALAGLAALHSAGLVHRDVKPDNIVVTARGRSWLVDFGLARPADRSTGGALEGSPAYMSPEQATGGPVDARSDVWSAGAVLFEALHGSTLHAHRHDAGTGPDQLARELLGQAGVPEALATLTARSLAHDAPARPADAGELLAELQDAAERAFGPSWRAGAGLGALAATVGARVLQQMRPRAPGHPAVAATPSRIGLAAPVAGAAAGILIAAAVTVPLALSTSASTTTEATRSTSPSATTATTARGGPASPSTTPVASLPVPAKLNLDALMVTRPGSGAGFTASQPVTPATVGKTLTGLLLPAQLVKDHFVAGRNEFYGTFSTGTTEIYLLQLGSATLAMDWLQAAAASGPAAFSGTGVPGGNGVIFAHTYWVRFVRGSVVAVVGAPNPGGLARARATAAAEYAKLAAALPP